MSNKKASGSEASKANELTPSEFLETAPLLLEQRLPVLCIGEPGIGKSSLFQQMCRDKGWHYRPQFPVVREPIDYAGLPSIITEDGEARAEFLPYGDMEEMYYCEEDTLFLFDDIGQAKDATIAPIMQLFLARELNGQKISDHAILAGASNERGQQAGVSGMITPMSTRFASIVRLVVSAEDWLKYGMQMDFDTRVLAYIKHRPDQLHQFKATRDITKCPIPRTWEHVSQILKLGIDPTTNYRALRSWICGAIGDGAGREFSSFIQTVDALPDPEYVLAHPEDVELPAQNRPDVWYAMCFALAHTVKPRTADAFFKFMERLPSNWQVLCVYSATDRNKALMKTDAFGAWMVENGDLVQRNAA